MKTTAKIVLNSKLEQGVGESRQVTVSFSAHYADGKNNAWAKYTPSMQVTMVLNGEVADRFQIGQEYTVTFEESEAE